MSVAPQSRIIAHLSYVCTLGLVHKFRNASHAGRGEVNIDRFRCVTHAKVHWKFRSFSVTTERVWTG